MKLFYSPTSPYVRKVTVLALEKGLDGRIERTPMGASPIKRDPALTNSNPLKPCPRTRSWSAISSRCAFAIRWRT